MFSLIQSFTDVVKSVDVGKSKVVLKHKDTDVSICVQQSDDRFSVSKVDNKDHSTHIVNLINKQKYEHVDEVLDMMLYVVDTVDVMKNYCVGCLDILDHQSGVFTTCGKDACLVKYEMSCFNNPVTESFTKSRDIVSFLIESTVEAVNCDRVLDVLEPFPDYFLKDGYQCDVKRGDISKLSGKNYDAYKDVVRLREVVAKNRLDALMDKIDLAADDKDLCNVVGKDVYMFLRFLILSCSVRVVQDTTFEKMPKSCKIFRVLHKDSENRRFGELKKDCVSHYLFHGSRWQNWFSLLRNGLKSCSGSKLQTAGAAMGEGAYFADDIRTGWHFGRSGGSGSVKSVVGVFEILGDREKYYKQAYMKGKAFVVPGKELYNNVQLKYLMISSVDSKSFKLINDMFSGSVLMEDTKRGVVELSKAYRRLGKEYKMLMKSERSGVNCGFKVNVTKDNLYVWGVDMSFDGELGEDLAKCGAGSLTLEMSFPDNYPFSPPFVRVVKPKLKKMTGNVSEHGAICHETLSSKHWAPACTVESLLVSIRSHILDGGGRVDGVDNVDNEDDEKYTLDNAKESFSTMATRYRWE